VSTSSITKGSSSYTSDDKLTNTTIKFSEGKLNSGAMCLGYAQYLNILYFISYLLLKC
jgi:hypothetical protein